MFYKAIGKHYFLRLLKAARIAVAFGCLPVLEDRTLLLKTPRISDTALINTLLMCETQKVKLKSEQSKRGRDADTNSSDAH